MNSVQHLHTFRLKSFAHKVSTINKVADLSSYIGKKNGIDLVVLGEGSNTIFLEDFEGEVLQLGLVGKQIEETETHFIVKSSASENWHDFVVWLLKNNVYGFENLALIPGTVGASPIQNIGAYGVEVKRYIEQVEYFDLVDGEIKEMFNHDCLFGYRDSVFKHDLKSTAIITSVTFKVPKEWSPVCSYGELAELESPTPQRIFDKVVEIRDAKLPNPKVLGNAGSFFKNPVVSKEIVDKLKERFTDAPIYPVEDNKFKLAAGWLIDQCGLKGYEEHGIAVHEKQALVLVNQSGNANGAALLGMIKKVRSSVFEKFGVILETEVRLISSNGELDPALQEI